jgi:hypothetical protein
MDYASELARVRKQSSAATLTPKSKQKHNRMTVKINKTEIAKRQADLARILSRQDPKLVSKGFKAYLHELPDLLDQGEEGKMVAYVKGERVALAPTPDRLREILNEQKLGDASGLFTRRVTETDVEDYSLKR